MSTKVVVNGQKTEIVPIYVSNATTANHTVYFRKGGREKVTRSETIPPGGQILLFTGITKEVDFIINQLDKGGYVDLQTAIANGNPLYYTVGDHSSVEKLSQIVEKKESNAENDAKALSGIRVKSLESLNKGNIKEFALDIKEEGVK